jgi:hypothetical protein
MIGAVATGGPLLSIRPDRPRRVVDSPGNGSRSARVSAPAVRPARVSDSAHRLTEVSGRTSGSGILSAGHVNLGNLFTSFKCQAHNSGKLLTCFRCQAHYLL